MSTEKQTSRQKATRGATILRSIVKKQTKPHLFNNILQYLEYVQKTVRPAKKKNFLLHDDKKDVRIDIKFEFEKLTDDDHCTYSDANYRDVLHSAFFDFVLKTPN